MEQNVISLIKEPVFSLTKFFFSIFFHLVDNEIETEGKLLQCGKLTLNDILKNQ